MTSLYTEVNDSSLYWKRWPLAHSDTADRWFYNCKSDDVKRWFCPNMWHRRFQRTVDVYALHYCEIRRCKPVSGLYFGVSSSNFLCGWIIHFLGWRYVFYISGAVSITWSVLWHFTVYETPREHPNISPAELIYIETSIGNAISSKQVRSWL